MSSKTLSGSKIELKITDHAIERFNQRISSASKGDACRRIRNYWERSKLLQVYDNMESRYLGPIVLVRRDNEIVTIYHRTTIYS